MRSAVTRRDLSCILITLAAVSLIHGFFNINGDRFMPSRLTSIRSVCALPCHSSKLSTSAVLDQYDNVNSIPGTSGPGIPKRIRSILTHTYGSIDTNATTYYGAGSGNQMVDESMQEHIHRWNTISHTELQWSHTTDGINRICLSDDRLRVKVSSVSNDLTNLLCCMKR